MKIKRQHDTMIQKQRQRTLRQQDTLIQKERQRTLKGGYRKFFLFFHKSRWA